MASSFTAATEYLRACTNLQCESTTVGIICGSGLSNLSDALDNARTIPFGSIPGFPTITVPGHKGELIFGNIGVIKCVCMRGRFHFYEGNAITKEVIMPVRLMKSLGVKLIIVTNAAGGLNKGFKVGDIMIIQDHIGLPCLSGINPLLGPNDERIGPRFPSMSDAYDPELQEIIYKSATALGLRDMIHRDGCYCFVSGPSYETRGEARLLSSIGADAVGASTVPEIIAAKHCGIKVLGLSLITNKVVTSKDQETHASHEEVLDAVDKSGSSLRDILLHFLSESLPTADPIWLRRGNLDTSLASPKDSEQMNPIHLNYSYKYLPDDGCMGKDNCCCVPQYSVPQPLLSRLVACGSVIILVLLNYCPLTE